MFLVPASLQHTKKVIEKERFGSFTGLFLEINGIACGITKKGQESQVKEHSFEIHPKFFQALRMLHPPKQDVVLKILTVNAGVVCNKGQR